MPDTAKLFVVESDASKWATGAVLRQQGDDREWHPCRYISHSFDATQQNYEIYDRELLGVICALEEWRHYLQGSQFLTVVLSDHKNLTYFQTAQKLNCRQARWSMFLSNFDLKLIHVPGSKMIQSDSLSRRPDYVLEDNDNKDMILLPDDVFIKMIDLDLQDLLKKKTKEDDFFAKALKTVKDNGPTPIHSKLEDWAIDDDLLFYLGKCYVPDDKEL